MGNEVSIDASRVKALFLCLEGLRYACGVCEASYDRAVDRLRSFESIALDGAGIPSREAMLAVADIWSVVDSLHRARILVARTPHLKRQGPEIDVFLRGTSDVERMRNYVQHLDTEISGMQDRSTPLWGSISWQSSTDARTSFTLMTNSGYIDYHVVGLVYDTVERKFVRSLELVVGNDSLDVRGVVDLSKRLDRLLRTWTGSFDLGGGAKYEYEPSLVGISSLSVHDATRS
jgi:hypothetical protein